MKRIVIDHSSQTHANLVFEMVITLKSSLTGEPDAITSLKGNIKSANLNDALLESYNGKKKNQVWLTLELWQTAGYSVRKGETAQMIWGKKQESTNKETGETG